MSLLASLQDLGLQLLRGLPLRPSPRLPPKVPTRCPLSPSPAAPFYRFPSSLPSLFRPRSRARSLRLCKHPPPLQSGQNSEGRGRRPPFPPVVGEGSAAAPGGGEYGGRLCAPPDQATRHTRGGGREAGLAERGVRPGRCGLCLGPGGLRGRGLRLQPRRGPGAARGLGEFSSLE